jgi:serine/threonine protein kinase
MNAEEIFHDALARPQAERRAFLAAACAGDEPLQRHLEALLHAHENPGSFLAEQPPLSVATVDNPIAERPGMVIGPYKLLEQIGEGGFGIVFLAEQQEPIRRKVALKVLKPGMDTRQVVARFEAERQALALMDHPNIAHVFDGGETAAGRPYFVMELVKGMLITDYCDQSQLTPRQRLELFLPVCQAVQHAHQKGIIHRDLKPSNVLVTLHDGTPVVKVIDFGIAKATGQQLTEKTLFTNFALLIGTPLYMSPEQAALSGLDVDTRSDIYSLGVLLYELLTGTTPFDRERFKRVGYDEMRRIIREEEPPKPSTRISTLGQAATTLSTQRKSDPKRLSQLFRGELDWIVMKALEKDRNRRYESASAVAADVHRYLQDEPVLACPPSTWYRLRKFARRNRVTVGMASLAALTLAAFAVAGIFAYQNRLAEEHRLAEQKDHEERLRAEKRQHALEKALMAAMSGDFDEADKAIDEAELLGASPGQVRMLRGQSALHQGDVMAATKHLEQAVKLMPESVAARALLALGYYNSGKMALMTQQWRDLDQMVLSTPEDYLFKGQVEALRHAGASLETLDAAVRRRNSVIARAVRTEARANRALFSGEVRDAELALEDAVVARSMLPNNPFVLVSSVYAQLVAAGIYEDKGQTKDRERVLEQAGRDVQKLKRFTSSPIAVKVCFRYFDYVGNEEAAFEMSRHGGDFRHVCMLYRRGDYEQALQAADRAIARGNGLARIESGFVLAELDNGPERAWDAFQQAMDHPDDLLFSPCPPLLALLLGKRNEAVQASLRLRQNPAPVPHWYDDWYSKYLDCNCGLITEDELLQAAGRTRPKLCEAHFLIGLRHLCEADRASARRHFQQCAQSRVFIYWDYMWARAFLKRLEKDPTWPPWIPPKK